jgi:hypothetical protein
LVYFEVIWYIYSHFVVLYREKSGNPIQNVAINGKSLTDFFFCLNSGCCINSCRTFTIKKNSFSNNKSEL